MKSSSWSRRFSRCLLALAVAGSATLPSGGQVVVDGKLGAAGALNGPAFQIPATLGRQVGGNLFHSFSQFNLGRGDVATFSGPTSVQNILARVTGGCASSIDGKISATIPGANFYLLNPAGIMFGPNASVDVSGSFVATTADYVKLTDGKRFGVGVSADALLSAAGVDKFGFLGRNPPGKITVDGSQLKVKTGQTLSLVGGDLEIKKGALVQAPQGTVNLTSVGAVTAEVTATPELTDLVTGGDIAIRSGASVDVSGEGGGLVTLRSGALTVDDGSVLATTTGTRAGRGVDAQMGGAINLQSGGHISSSTAGSGSGGAVTVRATAIRIDGLGSGIFSESKPGATGAAGEVSVSVSGFLQVLNGGEIFSHTDGSGKGGKVTVTAGSLTLDRQGSPYSTAIFSQSRSSAIADAGDVSVSVSGLLAVLNGAEVSSGTFGSGRSGRVTVSADTLTINSIGSEVFTGIASQSDAGTTGATGAAGDVSISVRGLLRVLNGGIVSSSTFGPGRAGRATVNAGALTIDGGARRDATGIFSTSELGATGAAGDVCIGVCGLLRVLNGGEISSDTSGSGLAGRVTVSAGALTIARLGSTIFTGISSDSNLGATGDAGTVTVTAKGPLQIFSGGAISSGTSGTGRGGNVLVNAADLQVSGLDNTGIFARSQAIGPGGPGGDIVVRISGGLSLAGGTITAQSTSTGKAGTILVDVNGGITLTRGSRISASAEQSDAGQVTVQSGSFLRLDNSVISVRAETRDGGNVDIRAVQLIHLNQSSILSKAGGTGGNIFIDPVTVSLNQSTINANAVNGNGGNITINTGYLIQSVDSQITASSQFGVSGAVSVLGPSVDLSGSLVPLASGFGSAESRLPERCAVRLPGNFSSFISVGRGGLPLEPGDPLPSFLLLDDEKSNAKELRR